MKSKFKFDDVQFRKIAEYDPLDDRANSLGYTFSWVGSIRVAFFEYESVYARTKAECEHKARMMVRQLNAK